MFSDVFKGCRYVELERYWSRPMFRPYRKHSSGAHSYDENIDFKWINPLNATGLYL